MLPLALPPRPAHFPYTTLFRSRPPPAAGRPARRLPWGGRATPRLRSLGRRHRTERRRRRGSGRSEEHTTELQSRGHIVCRLVLEKNNSGEEQKRTLGTRSRRGS